MSVREGSEMPWLLSPAHLYSASALCAPIGHLQGMPYQLGFAYHPPAPHPHHAPHPAHAAHPHGAASLFSHHIHHLQGVPYAAAALGPPPGSPEPPGPGPYRLRASSSPTS